MVHVIVSRAWVQQPDLKCMLLENCVNDAKHILQTAFKEAEVHHSFIPTTVWNQSPSSHHKGATGRVCPAAVSTHAHDL